MRHHLVVLHEPYFRLLITGRKRIECRLSSMRKPPFQSVAEGDLLWFKLPSGPVCGVAGVDRAAFHVIREPAQFQALVRDHARDIGAADGFFEDAQAWVRYVSLIWPAWVMRVKPIRVMKTDQRAWMILPHPPRPGMRLPATAGARR
jgi:ASC-1-like (ASCH) protein